MKRLLSFVLISVFLSGCTLGNDIKKEPVIKESKVQKEKVTGVSTDKEKSDEEVHASIKERAVKGDFVEMNASKTPVDTIVFLEGEVTVVMSEGIMSKFLFTTQEKDGFGIYTIENVNGIEVSEGDKVRLYGVFKGKSDEDGSPMVASTIIENTHD